MLLPAILLGGSLAMAPLFVFAKLTGAGLPDDDAAMLAFYGGIVAAMALVAWRARLDWGRVFGPAPTRPMLPLISVVIPAGLLSLAGGLFTYIPLSYVAPGFVERTILAPDAFDSPTSVTQWLVLMLVGAIAAPLVEEVLFRGLLMPRWAHRWGTTTGVVASSLLFAVLHEELLGAFVFGVAMCVLYLHTRRLWVPILAHLLNNFIALFESLPGALTHTVEPAQTLAEFRADWVWIVPLLAAALLTGWWYLRQFFPDGVAPLLRSRVPYESA